MSFSRLFKFQSLSHSCSLVLLKPPSLSSSFSSSSSSTFPFVRASFTTKASLSSLSSVTEMVKAIRVHEFGDPQVISLFSFTHDDSPSHVTLTLYAGFEVGGC